MSEVVAIAGRPDETELAALTAVVAALGAPASGMPDPSDAAARYRAWRATRQAVVRPR